MNDTCSICLNPVRKTRSVTELGCGHMFHSECIEKWEQQTCPTCRDDYGPEHFRVTISIENLKRRSRSSTVVPTTVIQRIMDRMNIEPEDIENYSTDITFDFDNLEDLETVLADMGIPLTDIDPTVLNAE